MEGALQGLPAIALSAVLRAAQHRTLRTRSRPPAQHGLADVIRTLLDKAHIPAAQPRTITLFFYNVNFPPVPGRRSRPVIRVCPQGLRPVTRALV